MNILPFPPLNVPDLLRQHGLQPKKSLGQNFLTDPIALERIVETGQVKNTDTILEIGPGLGSLTRHLAAHARQVIAVELDQTLIPILRQVLTPFPNVQIIHGDILQLEIKTLLSTTNQPANQQTSKSSIQQSRIPHLQSPNVADHRLPITDHQSPIPNPQYLVVANIPYYITSAVIRHLLESKLPPQRLVLTVQREVAERICAEPPDMSLLALSVQVYGHPAIAAQIPAGAFYPPPKVDSAVVRVDTLPEPRLPRAHLNTFFRLIKAGFSQKRKTLRNALSAGMAMPKEQIDTLLQAAHIDPMRRAETVSLDEWANLAEVTLAEITGNA